MTLGFCTLPPLLTGASVAVADGVEVSEPVTGLAVTLPLSDAEVAVPEPVTVDSVELVPVIGLTSLLETDEEVAVATGASEETLLVKPGAGVDSVVTPTGAVVLSAAETVLSGAEEMADSVVLP